MISVDLQEIRVFENYIIEASEVGRLVLSTQVVDSSINYYGNAHGGYLFTLCDQVAGLVARSLNVEAVTLQSNINYLKAGKLWQRLTVIGQVCHDGQTTKIIDVKVTNPNGNLVSKATFTMFVTGERKDSI